MTQKFTSTISEKNERIFGLDLMRACSIIMVFLSHSMPLNPFDKMFPFGWLGMGVEAFFVLSGFLIGRIIMRTVLVPAISWQAVKVFWVNRWLRTLPAYLVAFTIYFFFSEATRHRFVYLVFAQNILTPIPDFFPHSWSLAVEEWFYLLFPAALMVIALSPKRRSRHHIYLAGIGAFIIFGLLTKAAYHWMYQQNLFTDLLNKGVLAAGWKVFVPPSGHWDTMRKMVMFRIDAIAYGCLTGYLLEKYHLSQKIRLVLLVAGCVGLMILFQVVNHTVAGGKSGFFVDVLMLPAFCCTFALMLPYAITCPRPGKWAVKVITSVSQTSYSFYLMHLLIIEKVISWYRESQPDVPASRWAFFIGTYIFIYLVSYLMYQFVELPFMNYRRKLFPQSVPVSRL
nr:acyltransferase [uncultured Dyadobacter sp.]